MCNSLASIMVCFIVESRSSFEPSWREKRLGERTSLEERHNAIIVKRIEDVIFE